MPPSHSCRCERCWSLIKDCCSCLSACVLDLIYGLALQLAFKVALLAVHLFWITLRFLSLCFNSRDTPAHVGGLKNDPLHGFSLCFAILLFAWTFDLLTSTFLGSCPSVELLILFWLFEHCHSTMAPVVGWISIWGRWTHSSFELAETWKLALWNICSVVKLIANCLRGLMTCDEGVKDPPARRSGFIFVWEHFGY